MDGALVHILVLLLRGLPNAIGSSLQEYWTNLPESSKSVLTDLLIGAVLLLLFALYLAYKNRKNGWFTRNRERILELLDYRPSLRGFYKFLLICSAFALIAVASGEWSENSYTLVHWITTVTFALVTYSFFSQSKLIWCVPSALVLIFFNPYSGFHFDEEFWALLDILAAFVAILISSSVKGGFLDRIATAVQTIVNRPSNKARI